MRNHLRFISLLILAAATGSFSAITGDQPSVPEQSSKANETDRTPWTKSRIKGTPDPPLPFSTEVLFTDVKLKQPTDLVRVPGTDRWIAIQLNGKVFSFNRSGDPDTQLSIDLKETPAKGWHAYGIVFHPEYPKQPFVYISMADKPKSDIGTMLTRFTVTDPAIPTLDPNSEVVLMRWSSFDHMGGSMHFGSDGFLYFSIGDGQRPSPPDPSNTGQDISDLQSSVLRIDVNKPSVHEKLGELNYSIPPDNPFIDTPNARPEIWAFGVRNPWKMCFRPGTDELWTGDIGWEMREMVYRIDRGANYGWSVMEGSQSVKPKSGAYPIPITKPIVEHDHVEARSITGGYFWNHPRIPELVGAYIYGDWMTGKVWALKYDSKTETILSHREIADTPLQIISFALDDDGEVLLLAYDGQIHRLIENPLASVDNDNQNAAFPRKLSETGLFESVVNEKPYPGVIPFEINAHHWSDNTTSKRWIAVPDDQQLDFFQRDNWMTGDAKGHVKFPHDTVIAKTVYLQTDPGDPKTNRRIETQILHRYFDDWKAYNYVWNEQQTDAMLQDNIAVESEYEIVSPESSDGFKKQKWLHSSRDQCMLCHIWNAGTVHGFKTHQLNGAFGKDSENQFDKLLAAGLFKTQPELSNAAISPYDETASLNDRARSYLDLNCAHCHRFGGGGTGAFLLANIGSLQEMNLVDEPANQGDFGIKNAKLITSGDPTRSALLYRIMKTGHGRMPQFGTNVVDDQGVLLLYDWIKSLGEPSKELLDREQACKAVLKYPDIASVNFQLESTSSAMALAMTMMRADVSVSTRESIAKIAANHENAEIRDLFERFLPASQQADRLGAAIDSDKLLAAFGDFERGKTLWFNSAITCRNCHQIGGIGQMVGPSMDSIGTKRSSAEILQSILEPSSKIDEAYRGYIVATDDGELISGLKVGETENEITIVDSAGKRYEIAMDEIEEMRPMDKSLMPEQLLSELTFEQAVDLLAFLNEQK